MTPLETLKAARELISDPARHTTRVNARDAKGDACGIWADSAACWCVIGAVFKYDPAAYHQGSLVDTTNKISRKLFKGKIASVANDELGHSAALAILDAAIAEMT